MRSRLPQLLKFRGFEPWTGGVQGVFVPTFNAPFGLPLRWDQWLYLYALAVAVLLFVLAWNILRGGTGLALIAIRDHPVAAASMGIDTAFYKTTTFGLSAMYTGIAGALGGACDAIRFAGQFFRAVVAQLLVGSVIGGARSISGAVFGAIFIQFVPNIAEQISKAATTAVYGVLLIAFMY